MAQKTLRDYGEAQMKKSQVEIGATYIVKVSGKLARVRITYESPYGGWCGVNTATDRKIHIKSAARLRHKTREVGEAAFVRALAGFACNLAVAARSRHEESR